MNPLEKLHDFVRGPTVDIEHLKAQLTAQTNRAAAAEQQVTALTQRLDMANRLNTDAREQLAQLSARQAAPLCYLHVAATIFPDSGYQVCSPADAGAFPVYASAPPQPERETGKCPECGDTHCPRAQNHLWPCVPNPLRKRSHQ